MLSVQQMLVFSVFILTHIDNNFDNFLLLEDLLWKKKKDPIKQTSVGSTTYEKKRTKT